MPPGFQGLGVVDEGMLEIENLKQFCIGTTQIDRLRIKPFGLQSLDKPEP